AVIAGHEGLLLNYVLNGLDHAFAWMPQLRAAFPELAAVLRNDPQELRDRLDVRMLNRPVSDRAFSDAGLPDAGFPDAGFPDAGFLAGGFSDGAGQVLLDSAALALLSGKEQVGRVLRSASSLSRPARPTGPLPPLNQPLTGPALTLRAAEDTEYGVV